jgi:uncharacterized protein (DUF433 family)
MGRTITVSDQVYEGLEREAARSEEALEALAERWLAQRLDLERYPELVWRQGPGGWRVGIKGSAIDVYTVVGYVQAGYRPPEIVGDVLPGLAPEQVAAALRYYAEFPQEIERTLAESWPEAAKATLYRALGPEAYRQVTGSSDTPRIIREAHARYGDPDNDG